MPSGIQRSNNPGWAGRAIERQLQVFPADMELGPQYISTVDDSQLRDYTS